MKRIAFAVCAFVPVMALAGEHTDVMTYFLCSTDARLESLNRTLGRGKGQVVYDNAQKCLDEKLPAALNESGKNADLKAAVKNYHSKTMTWLHSPEDSLTENDMRQAESTLEMEGKLAGVWH